MISLLDINKSLVDRLRQSLKNTPFKSVPIVNSDLKEGFERPSLKIDISADREQINTNYTGRNINVEVYFFASNINEYKIENLSIQEIIEETFIGGWSISPNCFIYINDIESDIIDTVLVINFEFSIVNEILINDDSEYMESLELDLKGE